MINLIVVGFVLLELMLVQIMDIRLRTETVLYSLRDVKCLLSYFKTGSWKLEVL